MSSDKSAERASDEIETSQIHAEIESDFIARAREVYPATTTKKELVRRCFERGLRAREDEIEERENG